ncbi:hypothetical protein D039_1297A, partial [Vibrio parahaemolyticus EKP-028]
MGDYIPITC